MNTREIKIALILLDDHTDRIETIVIDSGGQALSVNWTDGSGSTIFYSFDDVFDWAWRASSVETKNRVLLKNRLEICKANPSYNAEFHNATVNFVMGEE